MVVLVNCVASVSITLKKKQSKFCKLIVFCYGILPIMVALYAEKMLVKMNFIRRGVFECKFD